jgi:uncharacterized membrane protein YqjE
MADQASVSDSKSAANGSPEGRVVGGIADFGNDVATLAELQLQLAQLDLQECVAQAKIPAAVIAAGLVVALGSVPVVLLGVAKLVALALNIGEGWGTLLTGIAALVLAAVASGVAAMRLTPSFTSLRRSREELARNVAWIRTVLVHSGRGVARRGR